MLRINVDGISEAELRAALTAHCSRFGVVSKVTICRPGEPGKSPVARVEMSSPSEARSVIEQTGGTLSGVAAIIPLERPAAQPPPGQKRIQLQ